MIPRDSILLGFCLIAASNQYKSIRATIKATDIYYEKMKELIWKEGIKEDEYTETAVPDVSRRRGNS